MKKNTKIIRLTENDLERMVKKIIKESNNSGSIEDYFSKEELDEIKEKAARLLSPGFFEDYEVTNYISTVSGNDKNVERMLVDWLKSEGLEFYQPEYRSDTGYFDHMDVNEDYMSSEEDLINDTYELLTDMGYEYVEDLYIQDLYEAAEILENELYDGNHGPHINKEIEDLLTNIYEIIGYPDEAKDSDEDYMDEMPKPGMFHKLKQGVRDLSGISNKNDSETLKQIYDLISKGMIDNVRRNSDVVTAYVNNKALIVDKGSDAEIIYAGRNLELANLESEAHDLYHLITYIS
jgi:hypothetical protein